MTQFPFSELQPVQHESNLPAEADTIVIGGGVIGVCTALFLAQAGQKVLLLEKGRIAAEQSSRNWGWIRLQGRDLAEIPIAQEAQRLWKELAPELDTDIGLQQTGVAYMANSEAEMASFETWRDEAKPYGVSTRTLTAKEWSARLPTASRTWAGALWTETDMRAEPFVAVPALARLAAREGALIRENCAVRGLSFEGGAISGVVTEDGEVRCRAVVVAAGAWSSLFLRRHGITVPQLSVRASVVQTTPMEDVFSGAATDDDIAFRRRADGGYTLAAGGFHELFVGPDALRHFPTYLPHLREGILGRRYLPAAPSGYPDSWTTSRSWALDKQSPFENMRILNPTPNRRKVRSLTRQMEALFPHVGKVSAKRAWAGMIDVMPDVVPVVDMPSQHPGLVIATGMCGHGFGIGPGFGRTVADMVLGHGPRHDLTRFRLSRFQDGTRLVPGPSL